MAELKRLIFEVGLMGPTLKGDKQVTLRKYRAGSHDFTIGEIIRGEFMDGLNILLRITDAIEKKSFNEMTDEEARATGFADAEAAFGGLREYYSDLKWTDLAATIRYEILKVEGAPVVSMNEYTAQ